MTVLRSLVVCLASDDLEIRHGALRIVEWRADMGADAGLAVPALLRLQHDADAETRRAARRALAHASRRLEGLLDDVVAPLEA